MFCFIFYRKLVGFQKTRETIFDLMSYNSENKCHKFSDSLCTSHLGPCELRTLSGCPLLGGDSPLFIFLWRPESVVLTFHWVVLDCRPSSLSQPLCFYQSLAEYIFFLPSFLLIVYVLSLHPPPCADVFTSPSFCCPA